MNQPPGGGGYGGPPPGYPPQPGSYGANPAAPGQPQQNPYAAPPQTQFGQSDGYRQPPFQQQGWPAPVPFGSSPGAQNWTTGGTDAMTVASKDPQQVFLLELLLTGLLGLPGVGHLVIGETGWGIALLVGYPLLVWGGWTLIILFSCGIGAFLVPLQWPINFLVGYFLGNRAKQRVLDARAFVQSTGGMPPTNGGWPP